MNILPILENKIYCLNGNCSRLNRLFRIQIVSCIYIAELDLNSILFTVTIRAQSSVIQVFIHFFFNSKNKQLSILWFEIRLKIQKKNYLSKIQPNTTLIKMILCIVNIFFVTKHKLFFNFSRNKS